jgi:autotransporter-associated beta strand protein
MHPSQCPGRCSLSRIRWRLAALLSLGLVATSPGLAADGVYTSTGSGIYSNTANWQGGIVADGIGSTATITVDVTTNRTFNLTTVSRTLGVLNVGDPDASHNYIFTGTAAAGTTLTFDNSGAPAQLNMASASGGVTIGTSALSVLVNDSVTVTQNSSSLLTLATAVSGGAGPGTKVIEHAGNGSGGVMVSAVVSDGGTGKVGVRQNNANGTLTLSNANTYTGGTVVDAGTLTLANNNRLADGGTLTVNGGTFDLGGYSDTVGVVTVGGGAVANGVLTGSSYAVTGGSISARLAGTGVILTKTGSGTAVLSGSNNYTGGTFINGGVLSVYDRTGFASRALTFDGGTLEITAPFTTNMTSVNATTLNSGGGTIRIAEGVSQSWGSATISGDGALTKTGAGELVLAANNTYTGGTFLNEGSISIDASARLNSSNGVLAFNGGLLRNTASVGISKATVVGAGGGTFEAASGTTNTWNGAITGPGGLTKTGDGLLVLGSVSNAFGGGVFIKGGVVSVAGDEQLGEPAGPVSFDGGQLRITGDLTAVRPTTLHAGGGMIEVGSNVAAAWDGAIFGPGQLTKVGSGSLVLVASNSFAGGVDINEGEVSASGDASLGNSGAPVMFTGGSLRTTANFSSARATTVSGAGATFNVDTGTTNVWMSPIVGTGPLTKVGGGLLILAGTNSYGGPTVVQSGGLHISGSLAGDVQVQSGASLGVASGVDPVGGTVTFDEGSVLDIIGAPPPGGSTIFPAGTFSGSPKLNESIAGFELKTVGGALILAEFVPQWQLDNALFAVAQAPADGFRVTQKATGLSAVFSPRFEIMVGTTSPNFLLATITGALQGSSATTQVNFSAASWGPAWDPDFAQAPGQRFILTPTGFTVNGQSLTWTFAGQTDFSFSATLDLSDGREPRLSWTITPKAQRYFSAGYIGAPSHAAPDEFYTPGIWSGRRFMDRRYLVDEARCSLPLGLIRRGAVLSGVFVDPVEIPRRISTTPNSLFAMGGRSPEGNVQPSIHAPIYGGAGSLRNTPHSFNTRLMVRSGEVFSSFRQVAVEYFGFRDYRKNLPGGSLNTALDNLCAFLLNRSGNNYVYWSENSKANEYVNDKPGYARFQSAVYPLSLALVRDSADLFEQRAMPSLEYFASRNRSLFKISGVDPEYPMGGPMSEGYIGEWITLSGLSGRRSPALEILGQEAMGTPLENRINHQQIYDRGSTLSLSKSWLRSLVTYYRVTGETKYLNDATSIADQYISTRLEQPASDFRDTLSSFWTEIGPIWDVFFELYDVTGAVRYRDAAVRALQEHITRYNFAPAVPSDGTTITVSGQPYPAWRLLEVGLITEAAGTSSARTSDNTTTYGHRGVLMPYAAASMVRAARYSGDSFYADMGKANIIGRFLNYPGYTVRYSYQPSLANADYPLRFYPSYINSGHMNHPLPMACMIVDYLVADAERRSDGKVWFPSYFSDTGGYFKTRVYGREPGRFFDDTEVYLWLPEGLLQFSGTGAEQINYIAAHGNNRLYTALSNQSGDNLSVSLQLSPQCVSWTPGAIVRVWVNGVPQASKTLGAGNVAINVPANGSVALAIDGVTPILELPGKETLTGGALGPASYHSGTASFGRVVGMIYSLVPGQTQAYVYTDAAPPAVSSATLHYKIGGGGWQTLVKATYPFEFSLPLPLGTEDFRFYVEAGGLASEEVLLDASLSSPAGSPLVSATDGAGQNAVQISWQAEQGASYRVERLRDEPPGFGLVQIVSATNGTFLDQGLLPDTTYTYRLRSVGASGESAWTGEFQVRTDDELEAWRRGYFGTRANAGASSDSADPEADGLPNLVEYAFGWNPLAHTRHVWLNGQKAFRIPPTLGRSKVTTVVQTSSGLSGWSEAARQQSGSAFVPSPGFNLVPEPGTGGSLLSPINSVPKMFYRLQAEPAPAN